LPMILDTGRLASVTERIPRGALRLEPYAISNEELACRSSAGALLAHALNAGSHHRVPAVTKSEYQNLAAHGEGCPIMIRLALTLFTTLLMTASLGASDIPHFNIEATCRAAPRLSGGIQKPFDGCMRDEHTARAELEKLWARYSAQQRTECVSLERIGGSPSYVDVVSCLQMYPTK
jgi:hypothetical protein